MLQQQQQHQNMTYEVLTDCCHPEYSRDNLEKVFYMYHPLKDMVRGLDECSAAKANLDSIDFEEVTFLAIVEGHATRHLDREFGPIFVTDDEHNRPTITGGSRLLLTADYYRYLKNNFGFNVVRIEWIIYYKRCEDLPKVFRRLIMMRNAVEASSPKDAFLKTIVNYACGYFGLNTGRRQSKMTARIAYKLPRRFNIFKDDVTPLDSFGPDTHLMLVQSNSPKRKQQQFACTTPLVLFIQIIEYGKLMLNRAVQCLQCHIRPTAMHILYSNVDNMILALADDDMYSPSLLHDSTTRSKFVEDWRHYKSCAYNNINYNNNIWNRSSPGKLKEEWCHTSSTSGWKFVSPCRMFHVLLTSQSGSGSNVSHHKSTFFTGLPTQEAFNIAMAVLRKQRIQLVQQKKHAKLVSTDTHLVTYNY